MHALKVGMHADKNGGEWDCLDTFREKIIDMQVEHDQGWGFS